MLVCRIMSEKRGDRMEQGRRKPQGHGDSLDHKQHGFDLAQGAVEELHEAGFKPEFGRDVQEQVSEIVQGVAHWREAKGAADLRKLGWSSIDNDTSKDLDRIEVAERGPA